MNPNLLIIERLSTRLSTDNIPSTYSTPRRQQSKDASGSSSPKSRLLEFFQKFQLVSNSASPSRVSFLFGSHRAGSWGCNYPLSLASVSHSLFFKTTKQCNTGFLSKSHLISQLPDKYTTSVKGTLFWFWGPGKC